MEQKLEISVKDIKKDAVIQFISRMEEKLAYYDKHNIKLSAWYFFSTMSEVLKELGYKG